MHSEWLAFEHYRLLVIEEWPDGPRRDAALAAVRLTIDSLLRTPPHEGASPCAVCHALPSQPAHSGRWSA